MSGTLNKGSLIKGSGGSGGGGSASFPTVVTDSGSSLPIDLTGYNEGDTFLNTSDKKIYTAQIGGYVTNTDVTNTGTLSANEGSVTFEGTEYIKRTNQFFLWYGSGVKIRIHFKLTSLPEENAFYLMFVNSEMTMGSPGLEYSTNVRIANKKLNLYIYSYQYGPSIRQNTDICETELQTNTDYYLEITKNDTVADITLSTTGYGENPIETNSVETGNYGHSSTPNGAKYQQYGAAAANFTIGKIYLADSTGEFVIPDATSLFWDSGVSLTDKIEVADKTNGALYLYENTELVKIGGSLTKKVYTISADNTSTLNVSSDFTKVVDVLKNGVELALTDDYTISNGVITFVTALSTTDKITVKGE